MPAIATDSNGKAERRKTSHGKSNDTPRSASEKRGLAMLRTGNDRTNKEEPMDKATQARQTGATYEYGYSAVQDGNGTADGATGRENGVSWLDSAALAECRRLTAENASLAERNERLRAALDEQGDELAALRRNAASVPTELESGRLLIVADSIASDADGLRTIEAYGRFFVREDGATVPDPYYYVKRPVDMDGVPWHIGDAVDGHGKVHGMGLDMFGWHFVGTPNAINPELYRHAKPRTLEDVLSDVARGILSEREGAIEIRGMLDD